MSARDELAPILRESAEGVIAAGLPVLTYADVVIAAGWRHRPWSLPTPPSWLTRPMAR